MSFGKCPLGNFHQKIPPDSPSLRVSTPSKSHATPLNETLLLAKWIFMNYRPFYINANETPNDTKYSRIDNILQTRENEKRCFMGKRLTNTFNIKKNHNLQIFCKVAKLPIL